MSHVAGRAQAEVTIQALILTDHVFHRTIVAASGNQIRTDPYDSLRDRQLRMMAEGACTVEHTRRNYAEHHAIERMIGGDGDIATVREAMRVHLASAAHVGRTRR